MICVCKNRRSSWFHPSVLNSQIENRGHPSGKDTRLSYRRFLLKVTYDINRSTSGNCTHPLHWFDERVTCNDHFNQINNQKRILHFQYNRDRLHQYPPQSIHSG